MVILAHDLEVPAFTREGARDVVRLTAGTHLAFVRDLDVRTVLCATGTPAHPLFVVLPRVETLRMKSALPSIEEFGEKVKTVRPLQEAEFDTWNPQEYYTKPDQITQKPSDLSGVMTMPPLTPDAIERALRGQGPERLDKDGRFWLNRKVKRVNKGERSPRAIAVPVGPKTVNYYDIEGYVVHDTGTGKTYPVDSPPAGYKLVRKMIGEENEPSGALEEAWGPFTIKRSETPDGPRYDVLSQSGEKLNTDPYKSKAEAQQFASEQGAKVQGAAKPRTNLDFFLKTKSKPPAESLASPDKPSKVKPKKTEELPQGLMSDAITGYMNLHRDIVVRFVRADQQYQKALELFPDPEMSFDRGAWAEAAALQITANDQIANMRSLVDFATNWYVTIQNFPQQDLVNPQTGYVRKGNLPPEIMDAIGQENAQIASLEETVRQFTVVIGRLKRAPDTLEAAASTDDLSEAESQLPYVKHWTPEDRAKFSEFEGVRSQYRKALYLLEATVLESSFAPGESWSVGLTADMADIARFLGEFNTSGNKGTIEEAEGDVDEALNAAQLTNRPMDRTIWGLIDDYEKRVEPIIKKGEQAVKAMERLNREQPNRPRPAGRETLPNWLLPSHDRGAPEGLPKDPWMNVVQLRNKRPDTPLYPGRELPVRPAGEQ